MRELREEFEKNHCIGIVKDVFMKYDIVAKNPKLPEIIER